MLLNGGIGSCEGVGDAPGSLDPIITEYHLSLPRFVYSYTPGTARKRHVFQTAIFGSAFRPSGEKQIPARITPRLG